jgi:hypothetical protein
VWLARPARVPWVCVSVRAAPPPLHGSCGVHAAPPPQGTPATLTQVVEDHLLLLHDARKLEVVVDLKVEGAWSAGGRLSRPRPARRRPF